MHALGMLCVPRIGPIHSRRCIAPVLGSHEGRRTVTLLNVIVYIYTSIKRTKGVGCWAGYFGWATWCKSTPSKYPYEPGRGVL